MPQPKELRQRCAAQVWDNNYPDARGFWGAYRQCYRWAVDYRTDSEGSHEIPVCAQHLKAPAPPVAYKRQQEPGLARSALAPWPLIVF